jgi:osmotically-inducible protein OsmY
MNATASAQPPLTRTRAAGEHLVRQAATKLQTSPYSDLRRLHVAYESGSLTLSGNVPSYYLKQMAQTIAAETAGVDHVRNRIAVVRR